MARSVAVRIKPPTIHSPLPPSCELSVQQVSDFVETNMSKPNGIADVIISSSSRRRRKKSEPLNFSLRSINSDRDLDRRALVYGYLQYYVNETREKLRRAKEEEEEEEEEEVESVRIELDELSLQLGDDWVSDVSSLMKWKFEYSGDDSLIKSCSALGCDHYYCDSDRLEMEREDKEKLEKKLMFDREGLDYEFSEEEIQSAMDPLLHWILACLRLALTFYPLVEEIVREHETVRDVTVTGFLGEAQFHAGRDAIQNIRQRQATSTSTVSSMIIEKMRTSPFIMKAKMWVVPFLEGGVWTFPTSIFGVATTTATAATDDDDQVMNIVDAFFDEDPGQQTFSCTSDEPNPPAIPNSALELEVDMTKIIPNSTLEVEMAKIMKKKKNKKEIIMPPTAELSVTWLFDHHHQASSTREGYYFFRGTREGHLRQDYIFLNH